MKRLVIIILLALLITVFARPVSARSSPKSYIIMAMENQLPSNLAQAVSAAGGTLTRTIPEIGVAVASSTRSDFATRAARISGLRSVTYNVQVQWLDPNFRSYERTQTSFGNPPKPAAMTISFLTCNGVMTPWIHPKHGAWARVATVYAWPCSTAALTPSIPTLRQI